MRKKLVIFDLDGTLLDTSVDLMNSMNGMLDFFGYPQISLEQTKKNIGDGARTFVLRSLPDFAKDNIVEAHKKYNEIYNASGSPKTKLYDGMDEVLTWIKEQGFALAIASNKPQPSTDKVYERYLKQFGFDYVYGNRVGFAHKPDKECGELILNSLGFLPSEVIVVGDGETDVKFANNLGCKGVAVTWGYRDAETLASYGADCFVDNPSELKEILNDLL